MLDLIDNAQFLNIEALEYSKLELRSLDNVRSISYGTCSSSGLVNISSHPTTVSITVTLPLQLSLFMFLLYIWQDTRPLVSRSDLKGEKGERGKEGGDSKGAPVPEPHEEEKRRKSRGINLPCQFKPQWTYVCTVSTKLAFFPPGVDIPDQHSTIPVPRHDSSRIRKIARPW